MDRLDFETVKSSALNAADSLLSQWLPDGKRNGHEYAARNPTRADKKAGSFSVNLNTGAWGDFATDDTGGDLISLYAYLFGCSQGDALRAVASLLRMDLTVPQYARNAAAAKLKKQPEDDGWEWVRRVPDDAMPMHIAHIKRGRPQRVARYLDTDGRLMGAVMRFTTSDGGKEDIPHTLWRKRETGTLQWKWRAFPEPRPLYGLQGLATDGDVLVVEGEKCRDAAQEWADGLGMDLRVLCWSGGCKAVDKADWSPLVGRNVLLWPDADSQHEALTREQSKELRELADDTARAEFQAALNKPLLPAEKQPGMAAMLRVAEILTAQDCAVSMVQIPPPGTWPDGYDIADALADGGELVDVAQALADAVPFKGTPEPTQNDGARDAAGDGAAGESRTAANLARLKAEFALVAGKERAVEKETGTEYSRRALIAHFDKASVESWFNWGKADVWTQYQINERKRHFALTQQQADDDVKGMMERYVYLDGSSSIWDNTLWRMIDQGAAKLAMGSAFKVWVDSPARQIKRFDHVVFEPGVQMPDHYINIYRGLPLEKQLPELLPALPQGAGWLDVMAAFPGCAAIQELIAHLCNGDALVMQYLYCWLAYPLQHPGAKMASAVVMHGDVHGAGKSLLFEQIIKPMYGDYAATLGQSDLESKYTGNRSGKLFILFEEIFNNKQKYDQTGAMKHMITGKTQRVERKFVDSYEEANHINCVFLSNEAQPFKIEENDRRYFVVWPRAKLGEDLKNRVQEEIGNGGIAQFFALLRCLPLQLDYYYVQPEDKTRQAVIAETDFPVPFDPHTQPPLTDAKRNVVSYGLFSWQTFFKEWSAGEIEGVPYCSAITGDVWRLYKWWCRQNNEREYSKPKFLQHISTKMPRAVRWWRLPHSPNPDKAYQNPIFRRPDVRAPDGVAEMDFTGSQVIDFRDAVNELVGRDDM